MAGLLRIKNEPNERFCVSDSSNNNSVCTQITIFDLAVLILSFFSIFVDIFTDLVLVIQYSNQGYKIWAIGTVFLIFFPSAIVQFFSLRWHIIENTACVFHWVLHILMLGIVQRYIQVIKLALVAFKSKKPSDIEKVFYAQNDLCLLHLFESFLESAPQLVLQLYVIAKVQEWRFWTGLSALASLLSLSWALAAYTKTQRRARANKNLATWSNLLFQAIWRTGMLTSRIGTLVLAAYSFGSYIFLIILIHWIAMTFWITYQKTDFCETYWEERIYNAVVGVIYCFCFFNLQEGQSRWRALAYYLIIVSQNLICLTIFLMWFGDKTPKLAMYGFIAVVGGIIFGLTGVLLYYRFYHPSGPIKFFVSSPPAVIKNNPLFYSSLTLRTLKRMHREIQNDCRSIPILPSDKQLDVNNRSAISDSVVIVEENILDNSDGDIKKLQDWINEPKPISLAVSNVEKGGTEETENYAYKRRAICASPELVKYLDAQTKPENDSLKSSIDETYCETLSVHDYENLCFVNISREAWGIRSWRGYFNIETELHDDSVVNSRNLDTLTSISSSNHTLQKESEEMVQEDDMNSIPDLPQSESKVSLDYTSGRHSNDPFSKASNEGMLEPIFEEINEWDAKDTEFTDSRSSNQCVSSLVATIEEIRMNTPTDSRYPLSHGICDRFPLRDINPNLNRIRKNITLLLSLYPEIETESPIGINEAKDSRKQSEDSTIKSKKSAEEIKLKRNKISNFPRKNSSPENKQYSEFKSSFKENVSTDFQLNQS